MGASKYIFMKAIRVISLVLLPWMSLRCDLSEPCQASFVPTESGNAIAYQQCGTGEEVLVFMHAGGLNKELWNPQVAHFKADYRVLTYDLRGHGASSFVSNDSPDVDDLLTVLTEKGWEQVTLVGCSLGAILALDFALTYPDLVNRLVLVSPGLIGYQENDPLWISQMTDYVQALQQADTSAMITHLKRMNALGTQEQLANEVDEYVTGSLKAFISGPGLLRVPQLNHLQPLSALSQVKAQSMVVYGAKDHGYIRNNAVHLASKLPHATLHTLADCGHLPGLETPEAFNELLSDFLTKN